MEQLLQLPYDVAMQMTLASLECNILPDLIIWQLTCLLLAVSMNPSAIIWISSHFPTDWKQKITSEDDTDMDYLKSPLVSPHIKLWLDDEEVFDYIDITLDSSDDEDGLEDGAWKARGELLRVSDSIVVKSCCHHPHSIIAPKKEKLCCHLIHSCLDRHQQVFCVIQN